MADPQPLRLILASGSKARRELMTQHGYAFTVEPAAIDEPLQAGFGDPRSYVQQIAWMKAAAASERIERGVVIAADTVGWVDGGPVLKPDDEADARRILRLLGGRWHELWTGVCLWRQPDGLQVAWQERSRTFLKAMTDTELDEYLQTREWVGCSGAYAVQENDPLLTVEGSVSNVVGLPMESLAKYIRILR
ncbi:MAG: nucleoside triphosphate pyrophosphatase [Gemmataceae bacterium]